LVVLQEFMRVVLGLLLVLLGLRLLVLMGLVVNLLVLVPEQI
jgi:hypothetical protein